MPCDRPPSNWSSIRVGFQVLERDRLFSAEPKTPIVGSIHVCRELGALSQSLSPYFSLSCNLAVTSYWRWKEMDRSDRVFRSPRGKTGILPSQNVIDFGSTWCIWSWGIERVSILNCWACFDETIQRTKLRRTNIFWIFWLKCIKLWVLKTLRVSLESEDFHALVVEIPWKYPGSIETTSACLIVCSPHDADDKEDSVLFMVLWDCSSQQHFPFTSTSIYSNEEILVSEKEVSISLETPANVQIDRYSLCIKSILPFRCLLQMNSSA